MRKLLRTHAYEYPINLTGNPVDHSQVFLVSSLRADGALFPSYLVRFAGNKAPPGTKVNITLESAADACGNILFHSFLASIYLLTHCQLREIFVLERIRFSHTKLSRVTCQSFALFSLPASPHLHAALATIRQCGEEAGPKVWRSLQEQLYALL